MTQPRGPAASSDRDRSEFIEAFDTQLRGPLTMRLPQGAQEEQLGPVFRSWGWGPRGFVQTAPLERLSGAQLDRLIQEQIQFFGELGVCFEWKTYGHDRTASLEERLRRAGLRPEETESVLIGRLAGLNHDASPPEGVAIRQVHSRTDTERMADLLTEVGGEDLSSLSASFFEDARANPKDVVLLVAEAAGRVIATGRVNLVPNTEFATLWAGSTLASWRHRGVYRALVAHRVRLALERGLAYLEVDASPASRPILERLGLLSVSTSTPYVWYPTPGPAGAGSGSASGVR